MRAYKGFYRQEDGTLWCRDFQYKVGKTYKFEGTPILCEQGFHACHEPHQCWVHYPNNGGTAYCEVECGGKIIESTIGDGKFVCTEITLVRAIPAPENKFDWCGYFREGYAIVRLKGNWNFINTEGKYLSESWWDDCHSFKDGRARVMLEGKYNFIDMKGKCISDRWFGYCWNFKDGYAVVELDGKYNFISTEGRLLSDQWFDNCYDFEDGYAKAWLDGRWYKIDKSGKITQTQL